MVYCALQDSASVSTLCRHPPHGRPEHPSIYPREMSDAFRGFVQVSNGNSDASPTWRGRAGPGRARETKQKQGVLKRCRVAAVRSDKYSEAEAGPFFPAPTATKYKAAAAALLGRAAELEMWPGPGLWLSCWVGMGGGSPASTLLSSCLQDGLSTDAASRLSGWGVRQMSSSHERSWCLPRCRWHEQVGWLLRSVVDIS